LGCLLISCGGAQQDSSDTGSGDVDFDATILAELNGVRTSVTAPANYTGTWVPLPNLNWSATLASSAQTWANTLRDDFGCQLSVDKSTSYGETLAYGSIGYGATQAVRQWAEERAQYTFNPSYQGDAGTYVQIIWRNTTQVGCAMAACETGWQVFVCYYDPPGNVLGSQPY
jgi:pathogenesis-related protein 1